MKKLFFILIMVLTVRMFSGVPSIVFKENKGQWPEKVLFGSDFLNTKFYINKNSFNYCVYNYKDLVKTHEGHNSTEKNTIIHGHNYEVNFVGGDLTKFTKKNPLSEYYNYFLGNDKSKWASNVGAFNKIEFQQIYKGIDLNVYSGVSSFEWRNYLGEESLS